MLKDKFRGIFHTFVFSEQVNFRSVIIKAVTHLHESDRKNPRRYDLLEVN